MLLPKWNLYDSMMCSSYTVTRFMTWTDEWGREKGVSMAELTRSSVNHFHRRCLRHRLDLPWLLDLWLQLNAHSFISPPMSPVSPVSLLWVARLKGSYIRNQIWNLWRWMRLWGWDGDLEEEMNGSDVLPGLGHYVWVYCWINNFTFSGSSILRRLIVATKC